MVEMAAQRVLRVDLTRTSDFYSNKQFIAINLLKVCLICRTPFSLRFKARSSAAVFEFMIQPEPGENEAKSFYFFCNSSRCAVHSYEISITHFCVSVDPVQLCAMFTGSTMKQNTNSSSVVRAQCNYCFIQ